MNVAWQRWELTRTLQTIVSIVFERRTISRRVQRLGNSVNISTTLRLRKFCLCHLIACSGFKFSPSQMSGHFTFWISLSLRLSLSPKFRLRPKISQKVMSFLPRDAMHKRGLRRHAVSVRPSVCLSRSWIMSKRINISSKFFHHWVVTPF